MGRTEGTTHQSHQWRVVQMVTTIRDLVNAKNARQARTQTRREQLFVLNAEQTRFRTLDQPRAWRVRRIPTHQWQVPVAPVTLALRALPEGTAQLVPQANTIRDLVNARNARQARTQTRREQLRVKAPRAHREPMA